MRRSRHPMPVLSSETHRQIISAIQLFANRSKWQEWGLDRLREQGAALLFHGEPGTGKTITAHYVAQLLKLAIREVSPADYGSRTPGQLARNIQHIFQVA